MNYVRKPYQNELYHYGIKGQKWGVRRYQNEDGSYTAAGKERYVDSSSSLTSSNSSSSNRPKSRQRYVSGSSTTNSHGGSSIWRGAAANTPVKGEVVLAANGQELVTGYSVNPALVPDWKKKQWENVGKLIVDKYLDQPLNAISFHLNRLATKIKKFLGFYG